ncbi:MAG TPA: YciI family protein [Stellaceae bacterium]|jgi:hypothetical protein
MLYAILCYDSEDVVFSRDKADEDAVMERIWAVEDKLKKAGRLGPVARLMPTTAATTIRKGREPLVLDGPFAETKEQLLGFFLVECASLDDAIETAKELTQANPGAGGYEVRPVLIFRPGNVAA